MSEQFNSIPTTDGKLQIKSAEIYYKIMGNGFPTFVLHGGPGDTHDTMFQLGELADQCKLIFYDQRAAGRSTGDIDVDLHTVEQFVDDLEQLRLNLAPEKINLIGGSWGAMLALQYASKHSQNINALVLMSSLGVSSEFFKAYRSNVESRQTPEEKLALDEIVNTDDFKKRDPKTVEKFWRIYFRSYFYDPDLVRNLHLWLRDSSYEDVPERYAKLREFLNDYDLHDDLETISCPTLILHGDYDLTPLEWVKPIHENIAGSQMSIVENAGHWLWVEAPDRVLPLIRSFLDAR